MTAKPWFVVFFFLIFLGPPAVFFVVEGFYTQFIESPDAGMPGLEGELLGVLAGLISIPVFIALACYAALASMWSPSRFSPPAPDDITLDRRFRHR